MTVYHKDLTGANIHSSVRWEFNDATARASEAGLTAADIGKLAWQKDNDTYWILKDHVGPAWNMNGVSLGTTSGTACEGNDERLRLIITSALPPSSGDNGNIWMQFEI